MNNLKDDAYQAGGGEHTRKLTAEQAQNADRVQRALSGCEPWEGVQGGILVPTPPGPLQVDFDAPVASSAYEPQPYKPPYTVDLAADAFGSPSRVERVEALGPPPTDDATPVVEPCPAECIDGALKCEFGTIAARPVELPEARCRSGHFCLECHRQDSTAAKAAERRPLCVQCLGTSRVLSDAERAILLEAAEADSSGCSYSQRVLEGLERIARRGAQ